MTARFLRRLRRDRRGVTVIEFAFVAPVMCLLIMGLGDMAYQGYVQVILTGALQKAGRDSTIQGATGRTDKLDLQVMNMVRSVNRSASYVSSRLNYDSFNEVGKPEPFQDNNNNGVYDAATECFTDMNGNGVWDADRGATGQGGANDVVLYTIKVSYQRLFPVYGLFGWPQTAVLSATTVLKNQPYASQVTYQNLICPK